MTPEEWDSSAHPQKMLEHLRAHGRASDRKLRLFALACCRRVEYLLRDERVRRAVEVVERLADGHATPAERKAARRDTQAVLLASPYGPGRSAAEVVYQATTRGPPEPTWFGCSWHAAEARARQAGPQRSEEWQAAEVAEYREQVGIVRDLFGNPFRPPLLINPIVLAYNGGAAKRLAEVIYRDQRFEDLPVLADLLEDAGCTDAELLGHLRGPGPHALGCFALDAVLGKT